MDNNPNLDLINIKAYTKFGQIPSIRSEDIERKQNRNHGQPENSTPVIVYGEVGGGGGGGGLSLTRCQMNSLWP